MITRLLLVCALTLSVVPASADDSAQANRLLVEATKSFHQANHAGTAQRLDLLQSALAKLNEIVEAHPSSHLAVQIITDQQIGILSLGIVARSVCLEHMQSGNFQDALAAAIQILNVSDRDGLLHEVAVGQTRAGDIQAALATANMLSDSGQSPLSPLAEASPRDALLATIAEIQMTEIGDSQGARDTIDKIKPGQFQNQIRRFLRLQRR